VLAPGAHRGPPPLCGLARFLVRRVLAAPTAVLFVFNAAGLLLLVLRRRVIPALAVSTFQGDDVSHVNLCTLCMAWIRAETVVQYHR
jgi:hypothetical protein